MTFYFNPQDIITAAYNLLIADSTIIGSTYLTSSGRIYRNRYPDTVEAPFCLITLDSWIPDDNHFCSGELRVFCFTKLLGNGQIDERGNRILSRCEQLLNNQVLTVSGATAKPLYSLGIVSSFYNSGDDKSKARGVLRLRVEAGKN